MIRTLRPVRIINVPLDLGASRRGTEDGPRALRVAGLSAALECLGYPVCDELDIPVPVFETSEPADQKARFKVEILAVCERLARRTVKTLQAGAIPLVLGGDHSIAMGTMSGISAHLRTGHHRAGLLWFDAHADMNTPDSSPSGNIHGMPLAHLLGYGDTQLSRILGAHPAVAASNVAIVGLRDLDRTERRRIINSGVSVFTMDDIDAFGMAEIARRALDVVNGGTTGFHISFDVDGCDPAVMPATGTPVAGGVNLLEAHLLLRECARNGRMISMEVVELNPFLDPTNISAERAVGLIRSAMGGGALNRVSRAMAPATTSDRRCA